MASRLKTKHSVVQMLLNYRPLFLMWNGCFSFSPE